MLSEPVFKMIRAAAESLHLRAFVVGGYVRDAYLGRASTDIDIVTIGSGIELARRFAALNGREDQLSVFKNFGTAMVRHEASEIEFVGARKESYRSDTRKPFVEDGSLEDDLARRDFTINALAIELSSPIEGNVIDLFGGMDDLKQKRLRTPQEPGKTFSDDPLRMMRAVRFSSQLSFEIDPKSLSAITEHKDRIKIVSAERIRDELNKIILSNRPSVGFLLLDRTGLLEVIFPELNRLKGVEVIKGRSHKDNFLHTLEVLDNVARETDNLWVRWAALLHDIAKPQTKRFDLDAGFTFHGHEDKGSRMVAGIFKRMALPLGEPVKLVEKLVLLHLRPIVLAKETVTDSAVRRLLFDAGDAIDSLMLLCNADVTTKNEYKATKYRNNFELVKIKIKQVEEKDQIRNWQPPVSGLDIMELFGIREGREVGKLKTLIREAILDGEIANDRTSALELLISKGTEMGLLARPLK